MRMMRTNTPEKRESPRHKSKESLGKTSLRRSLSMVEQWLRCSPRSSLNTNADTKTAKNDSLRPKVDRDIKKNTRIRTTPSKNPMTTH